MKFQAQFARLTLTATLVTAATAAATLSAHANTDARGIWYDHDGRGAVEIKACQSNPDRLCGHVVYVKQARHKKRCGTQIIGNVRANGRGWIYSPSRGRSYPLAVKRLSDNRLRIVGNAGSFFTKTYVWKRAPDSIVNCGQAVVAKKEAAPVAKPAKNKKVQKVTTPAPAAVAKTPKAVKPKTTALEDASSATAALLSTPAFAAPPPPKPAKAKVVKVAAPETGNAKPVANDAAVATNNNTTAPQETSDTVATANETEAAPEAGKVDDLSPPGGLTKGGDEKLAKLKSVIDKFTGGKGLKQFKGGGKCRYRIPYVGRTIRVPCK